LSARASRSDFSPFVSFARSLRFVAGLAEPAVEIALTDRGGVAIAGSPADFGRLLPPKPKKRAKVVKFSGAKPE